MAASRFISITFELCGIHSLSFAVGLYLPIATTAPIFAGGLVRWFVERKTGVSEFVLNGPASGLDWRGEGYQSVRLFAERVLPVMARW